MVYPAVNFGAARPFIQELKTRGREVVLPAEGNHRTEEVAPGVFKPELNVYAASDSGDLGALELHLDGVDGELDLMDAVAERGDEGGEGSDK